MYLVKLTKHSDQLQANTSRVFGGLDSTKPFKSISSTLQFAKFGSGPNIQNILFPKKADENGEKNEFSVNDELTFDG